MSSSPVVGIGHLTMLDVAPPDWVTLAAQTGFDAVGIRAKAASPGEEPWPMEPDGPLLAQTQRRIDDTGVRVLDIEIIRLAPETNPADHLPLLEIGALLGARFVNVIGFDPVFSRARENFHAIVAEARSFGMRPVLEPLSYSAVRNLRSAVAIVEGSGGGVTVDPLHLRRCGDSPGQLRAIDRRLLLFYQLCDAPLADPVGLPRPKRLPRGQPLDVDDRGLESRAARLIPGEGELPLTEIVAAMPSDIPVSVEAPNLALWEKLGGLEFLRRARLAADRLLGARQMI